MKKENGATREGNEVENAADVPMLAVTGPGSMDTDAFSS